MSTSNANPSGPAAPGSRGAARVDTSAMRLLVVEDDPMIGRAMRQGLAEAGFAVDWTEDGRAGELALATDVYDLVLLDLGLPSKDGMTLLEGLRQRGNQVPVIIVTYRISRFAVSRPARRPWKLTARSMAGRKFALAPATWPKSPG